MKKLLFLFAFMTLGLTVSAQYVPSIPRQQQSSSNQKVVWGTEFDWLAQRYVTAQDIAYYDRGQIRVLKNAIYARHGRKFKDQNLRAYFNSLSWYRGWRNEIPASELNKYEKANIAFLHRYE